MFPPCILLWAFVLPVAVEAADTSLTYDVCDTSQPGGAKCICSVPTSVPHLIIYECSLRSLTSVPTTYGKDTYEINLSNNKILQVERFQFTNLRYMELLYLQANYIRYIEPGAFNGLMRLKEIFLTSNRLENISSGVFDHLPALEKVHLENNYITTIGRYAFFTAPSLTLINFDSNPLTCGCEEKFFREFLDVRVGILTLRKARCNNLKNADLATMETKLLPSCHGNTLFLENNYCYTCADVQSPWDCGKTEAQSCSGQRDVCFTRMSYENGHLGVWGGCSDYTSCVNHEAYNKDKCNEGTVTDCHYCTLGRGTNRHDILDTVKSFEILATVTLDSVLTPELQDPTSQARKNYQTNFINVVNNIIYSRQGSYNVTVTDIRSPHLTIELNIKCTTVWYVSKRQVLKALNNSLNASGYINGSPLISLHLILKEDAEMFCLPESITTATFGTFNWPQTRAGVVSLVSCPNEDPNGRIITASRSCILSSNGQAVWAEANFEQCYPLNKIPAELQQLAGITITDENVADVAANVSKLSQNWDAYTEQELSWTVDIVDGILRTNAIKTKRDAVKDTLQTLNNVLYINATTLKAGENRTATSSRLIRSVDLLLTKTDVTTSDFGEVHENMAGFVIKTTFDSFDGLSLSTDVANESPLTLGKVTIDTIGGSVRNDMSGIQIPTTALTSLPANEHDQVAKGTFSVYREPKLFNTIVPEPTSKAIILDNNETVMATRQINSHVLGASYPGVAIKNLNEPVKVTFQHFKVAVNPECVYWKPFSNRGGLWANDGCRVNTTENTYTICDCNHLTNFALLMDVYGSGGDLSDADRMALAIISYIGCGVSFLAMCLTIITFLMFKKLRKENPGKILMNLCIAIGFADLVFVAGMQSYTSNSPTGCKVVATILHFFLLAAICWMAVEAFYMYLALIKVFNTYIAHFQLKSSLFGWGIPLVIVGLTLAINKTDNYGLQPGGICWLSRIPFYAAFLGPVVLIIIINSVVFVFVMKQIVNRSSNKLTNTEKSSLKVRLKGAISVIVLLGLTWMFAIFAVGDFGLVFHYLFAIFNSMQGLFIFIFYCFMKSDVRNLWKRRCACFKSPYEATDSATRSRERGYSGTSDQLMKTNASGLQTNSESRRPSDHNGKISPSSSPALTKPQTVFRGRWQLQQSENKAQTVSSPDILSYTDV